MKKSIFVILGSLFFIGSLALADAPKDAYSGGSDYTAPYSSGSCCQANLAFDPLQSNTSHDYLLNDGSGVDSTDSSATGTH